MNATIYSQKDEFTRFILELTHNVCAGLFHRRKDYPIDALIEEEIRYYSEILCARGLWKRLHRADYESDKAYVDATTLQHNWSIVSLDEACDEFIAILNAIVDAGAKEKATGNLYIAPDFRAEKTRIKEKISSMLSEENAIRNQKVKNLALRY